MKRLFLIGNAHIDPSWQWQKEEGVFAAITTFSAAADFCEEFDDGFVFNHNEAMLYMWIEKYAGKLFERIQKLVKAGKWRIIGGWYLQPDVVMSSGESIVRQIVKGRRYFSEKFGAEPEVAVNFDSFGHSAGLVQILRDAGYTGYICMRPELMGEQRDFEWKGLRGESVKVHRLYGGYNSFMGKMGDKLEEFREYFRDADDAVCFWGIGNHGGGPTRTDFLRISEYKKEHPELKIEHTYPEKYFSLLAGKKLPVLEPDAMNYVMQGCYTSQIRVKQAHQNLENSIWQAEKMAAHAAALGADYPKKQLDEALLDLLYTEFHDALPGSGIRPVEEQVLRQAAHGTEIAERVKLDSFLFLTLSQPKAGQGEFPILVYNPHPFSISSDIVCEFMLPDQNRNPDFAYIPELYREGKRVECQLEKEYSNVPIDWRKRISFHAELSPFGTARYSLYLKFMPRKETVGCGSYEFRAGDRIFEMDPTDGKVLSLRYRGRELLGGNIVLRCYEDVCDSWGFDFDSHNREIGMFMPASAEQAGKICGLDGPIAPVRVIEHGKVSTVIEQILVYRNSYAVVRYVLSETDEGIEIRIRLFNAEKDVKYRLDVPFAGTQQSFGKTMYGVMRLPYGRESVSQDWVLMRGENVSLGIVKFGNYGGYARERGFELTLMRAAGYCAHPFEGRKILPADRYSDRMEQGERDFRLILVPCEKGTEFTVMEKISVFAHQPPYCMNCFPLGGGSSQAQEFLKISNDAVSLSALKRTEDEDGYVLRLFNASETEQKAEVELNGKRFAVTLGAGQFRTIIAKDGEVFESDILERKNGRRLAFL